MPNPGPENPDQQTLNDQVPSIKKFDWLSAGQFFISLIIGLLFLGTALLNSLILALGNSASSPFLPDSQILSSWLFSAGVGFGGLLMIPSVYYSGRRLFRAQPDQTRDLWIWKRVGWISSVFPILILAGYLIQTGPAWIKVLLPLIHAAANGAAIFWLLGLVYKKLPDHSAQRFWGAFGAGLTIIPVITFIIEILILLTLGLIWIIVLQSQPDIIQELLDLANRLQQNNLTPEIIQSSLDRFITVPGVIATILLYIAVLIPLVEEILKTAVLWFLLGRKLTPQEGFLIGAASGAGYALFENLTIGAAADAWTFVMISRLGTSVIHILATGMVGWGLTSAWTEKKYFRLAGSFIAAVSIHGIWNGLNILTALAEIAPGRELLSSFGSYFLDYAPAGLLVLALGSFVGLLRANKSFRRAIITPSKKEKRG